MNNLIKKYIDLKSSDLTMNVCLKQMICIKCNHVEKIVENATKNSDSSIYYDKKGDHFNISP